MVVIQLTRKRPTTICNGGLCKTIVLIVVAAGVVCDNTVSNAWLIDGSILIVIIVELDFTGWYTHKHYRIDLDTPVVNEFCTKTVKFFNLFS